MRLTPQNSFQNLVLLNERTSTILGSEKFRYGYQGSEKDNEVKGEGNSYTTYFRQLDPRLGRWLTIDPKIQEFQSPYSSMDNNPILFNDPKGDRIKYAAESGKARRELRRMIREARKQDAGFDQWFRNRRADPYDNNLSFTGNTQVVPTRFTSPKYIGGQNQPGSIISIDAAGTETGGNNGTEDHPSYYFCRLQRMKTEITSKKTQNSANLGGIVGGPGYNSEKETYKAELDIQPGLFIVSGYTRPNTGGLTTVNFRITDDNKNLIGNFSVNQIRKSAFTEGTNYGPLLFNTSSSKIFIEVSMTGKTGNWSFEAATWKTKINTTWKFNPLRLFKREGLGNL